MIIFKSATDSDPRLLRARMDLLVGAASGSWPFMLALLVVIGGVMWPHAPPAALLGWLATMALVMGARAMQARHFRAEPHASDDRLLRFHRDFVLGTAASGLGWGLGWGWSGALLFHTDQQLHQTFLCFVVAGVSAAAVNIYAADKLAARLFLYLAVLPLAAVYLSLGDQTHIAMGGLLLGFAALMTYISGVVNAAVLASLTLRFENENLIEALTHAKHDADEVNCKLKGEIEQRRDTEMKLIEARDRAEQAARAKSDFLATMSHEIRTPMNGVLGMTELILYTELSSKQHRFASTIRRSGEALLAIINDILDFSKIEAGKLEIQHTVFDLRQLVEDTVAFFAEQAQRKRLSLLAVFPPKGHAAYRGDPDRIRQILMNLVGNAIKFTEAGDVVLAVETLESGSARDVLRFEVRDSGIGIKPEHQQHIFASFQQADGSTTRKFGGTGLGLAICSRLVELMQGSIGVDSEPGRGSRFWFSIGLARMPASSIAAQVKASVEFHGRRVLVVDDHATNREILKHQLQNWGMSYHGAADGGQGLKCLHQAARQGQPFHVAILDRCLPDIEGIELAKRIKSEAPIAATRLVMLSSIDQLEQTGQWLQAGIEVYVNKPVRQAELHDALSTALAVSGESEDLLAVHARAASAAPRQLGAHVLLAEDNPVNQELARTMLEDLGCTVVVVENGQEALDAISDAPFDRMQRPYDVVLMDCQMPVLDGFEATRQIRRWEAHNNRKQPLPVVALTANALAGDRERCLKSGMDDYLAKPFTQEQLASLIKRWMTLDVEIRQQVRRDVARDRRASDSDSAKTNIATLDQKVLGGIRALHRDGKEEVLSRIVGMYLKNSPKLLEKLQEAASTGNNDLLRNAAHSLKSASANLGATRLATLCDELEELGRSGGVAQALAPLGIVEFEFEAVCNALAQELAGKAA